MSAKTSADLARIESLWQGELGAHYRERTHDTSISARRYPFWRAVQAEYRPASVLEIGCGAGHNLACFDASASRTGVDVSAETLAEMRLRTHGQVTAVQASAARLPFGDASFDLVLCVGVLIHVPDADLDGVLRDVARVSRGHVLLAEYEDSHDREIVWRGQRGVLWARPFGLRFWRTNPDWRPLARGHLTQAQGFDNVGWSTFGAPLAPTAQTRGLWPVPVPVPVPVVVSPN